MGGMIAQELALAIPGARRRRSCSARPRRAARWPRRRTPRRSPSSCAAPRSPTKRAAGRPCRTSTASARAARAAERIGEDFARRRAWTVRRRRLPRAARGRDAARHGGAAGGDHRADARPPRHRGPHGPAGERPRARRRRSPARACSSSPTPRTSTRPTSPPADEAVLEFARGLARRQRRGSGRPRRRLRAPRWCRGGRLSGSTWSRPWARRLGDQAGVLDGHDAVVLAVDDEGRGPRCGSGGSRSCASRRPSAGPGRRPRRSCRRGGGGCPRRCGRRGARGSGAP